MSIFPKFFFTLFGNAPLPFWLRSYIARVEEDGGTIVDTGHTKEVYADTYPYEPTLIQPCSGGGSTPQNFAVGSEDISNATYWAVSEVTATSDAEPNPFGGSGVSLVAETGATTAKGFYQQSVYQASIVLRQAYTISAYVKKGDGALAPDIIQITYLSGGFGTDFYANYNISTGVVTKVNGGFADIQDIGGGWYRISLAGVAVATGALGTFVLAFVNNDPNATRLPSYTGNTSRDVYVWGVQFVQGNEPGEYIKTTTAAIDSIGTLYSIIPSRDLLLYQYTGAAAAYSLRSLSAGTVYVVKVRRSGDNAELDFTADEVSDGTLAAWVVAGGGTEDGFVTTWYDQSGNANNATQTTAANQPKIVSSGSLITQGSKAAMELDGVNDCLVTSQNNPFTFTGGVSIIHASYKNSTSYKEYETIVSAGTTGVGSTNILKCLGFGYGNQATYFSPRPTISTDIWQPSGIQYDGTVGTNERHLIGIYISNWSTHRSTGLSNLRLNGSDLATKSYGAQNPTSLFTNPIKIGVFDQLLTESFFGGSLQEIIIYASDQSANRTGIEANINAHYNIYP
jgi:hypothetical protein